MVGYSNFGVPSHRHRTTPYFTFKRCTRGYNNARHSKIPEKGGDYVRRILFVLLLVGVLMLAGATMAQANDRFFITQLKGDNEVPAVDTRAVGVALFHLNRDGDALRYTLIVANIHNVVASHIHLAPEGVNGPVVATLFGPAAPGGGMSSGVLARGTITSSDLSGPLAGKTLADLVKEMRDGDTYVNVHTNDGVEPPNTGPGDIPAGEIRGQIR